MDTHHRRTLEAEPFLDADGLPDAEAEEHPWIGSPSAPRPRWQQSRWQGWARGFRLPRGRVHKPIHVVAVLTLVKGILVFSGLTLLVPMLRLIEDAFCHEHYGKDLREPIDEKECKGDEVQSRLAFFGAVSMVIGAVIGLVVAFPYGIMADRVGRKPTLLLSYAGIILSFSWGPLLLTLSQHPPIWLMMAGAVFTFIGGGVSVLINTLYSMASDVSTEETRSSNFLYMSLGAVVASLAAPVTAGFLMQQYGPWAPVRLVFGLSPLIVAAILALPETLRIRLGSDDDDEDLVRPDLPFKQAVRAHLRSGAAHLRDALSIATGRDIMLCLVPPLIGNALWTTGSGTTSQFISKYYGWSIAQTSYLMSPLGLINMAILAALPWLSARLVDPAGRWRWSGFRKDLVLLRVCYVFMALSFVIQGASGSIVVFVLGAVIGTVGSPSAALARAVASEFVDKKETSRLYATLSIMDMAGAFIGGPVVAWCLTVGMRRGDALRGLPFFYTGFLCLCALAAMMLVREPRRRKPAAEEEEGEEAQGGLGYESAAEDD